MNPVQDKEAKGQRLRSGSSLEELMEWNGTGRKAQEGRSGGDGC